jgi:Domain of unknown function (DUF3576)
MASPGFRGLATVLAALALTALVGACSSNDIEQSYPESIPGGKGQTRKSDDPPQETVFGPGGFDLFGIGGGKKAEGGSIGVGVNSYLWRASLDTVSFMPLASADPFGGVIITDWYAPPETPDERFKMNIYILGRELRADGLRVAVFRQNHATDGHWVDAVVKPETATDLENQILTRARQLRIATANR